MKPRKTSMSEGFWEKAKIGAPDECWPWLAARCGNCGKHGKYGEVKIQSRVWRAHRVAWIIANGEIPERTMVLHKCDNSLCVNPSHLFLGDAKSNAVDMSQKGRSISKFSHDDVREIRRLRKEGWIYRRIAEKFSAPLGTIYSIVMRRHFRMLE